MRSRIQFLVALLILSLGMVVLAWFSLLADQSAESEVKRDVEGTTRALSSLLFEQRESLLSRVSLLAEVASSNTRSATTEAAESRLKVSADVLAFVDSSGKVRGVAGATPKAVSASIKPAAGAALDGRRWTGITYMNGRMYVAASAPTQHSRGAVVGLVALDSQFAKKLRDAVGAEIAFLRDGKVVASSMKLGDKLSVATGAASRVTVKGTEYMCSATPLPGTKTAEKLRVALFRDMESVVAPLRGLSVIFVTALLCCLAVALVLASIFSRSLTHRLNGLVSASDTLRDGNWPEPLKVTRSDEIGLLQTAFNEMANSLREGQSRMLHLLDTDPLTELHNHRRFKERLDQEVFRACMNSKPLTLALIDIDDFAAYNTSFGHAAGDLALKVMAGLLNESAPDVAVLARYGGEEFALLLPMNTVENTEAIAERVRQGMDGRFLGPLTVSIGIAELTAGVSTGAALLLSAEMALGRAKQLGCNRVCRFDAVPGATSADDPFQLQKYLEDSSFATIQALAGAVDAKDPYTQGHSVRVAKYASDLAKYVGCTPEFVDLVYRTGTLHDVGKIGVPDSILTKPSRLETEEHAIMETHPVLGELIVRKAPQLSEMVPGVRHHHERWDGRGYPDKLMGDKIPRLARFIAIADTYDAMTSDRPYRKALSDDYALDEIERGAGTQFDPALAMAFVRMMRLHGRASKAA